LEATYFTSLGHIQQVGLRLDDFSLAGFEMRRGVDWNKVVCYAAVDVWLELGDHRGAGLDFEMGV
jgi:hypothetical protein